jgi:LacI family transcriptional regulator
VAASTREHVQRVIDELEYAPGRAARALRHGSSGLVDVAVEALDSEYVCEIIRSIEEALEPCDLRLVLSSTGNTPQRERQWVSKVTDGSTDGAILVLACRQLDQSEELSRRGIPFVVVDHRGDTGPDAPSVGATNYAGGRAATQHLLSLGHRRIAVIGGPIDMRCSQERIAGYRAALDSAGIAFDAALVRHGTFHLEAGEQETKALLALPDPPTGIFAGSDLQALGVYNALRTAGLSVPSDVSVVGFDDVPMAALASPHLTTVRQPLADMGRMATNMLVQLLQGVRLDTARMELATTLVTRESCAPPRSA